MCDSKRISDLKMNCNFTEEQIVIFNDIATRDFYNQDYNNLRSDQKFQMFASMISDDPADHLNPIFEDLLESYVKLKTAVLADEARIAKENKAPEMKKRKIHSE